MNRLQNLILVLWGLALLLFVAFNWQDVWEPVEFVFLFMEFELKLWLWLAGAGFGIALLIRLLAAAGSRRGQRRADKEIHSIKARAFDGVTGDFEKLVTEIKVHMDGQFDKISSLIAAPAPVAVSEAAPLPSPPKPEAEAAPDKGEDWRALAGAKPADGSEVGNEAGAEEDAGADRPDAEAAKKEQTANTETRGAGSGNPSSNEEESGDNGSGEGKDKEKKPKRKRKSSD